MLNFSALCPDKWKRGLILCMLNMGKRICSNGHLFYEEVEKLRKMFKLNGYPEYQNIFPLENTFAKRENVRLGQSPIGTQMRSFNTFFAGARPRH